MQIGLSSMLDLHLWVVDIHTLMHEPSAALCGQQLPQQRRLLLCIRRCQALQQRPWISKFPGASLCFKNLYSYTPARMSQPSHFYRVMCMQTREKSNPWRAEQLNSRRGWQFIERFSECTCTAMARGHTWPEGVWGDPSPRRAFPSKYHEFARLRMRARVASYML